MMMLFYIILYKVVYGTVLECIDAYYVMYITKGIHKSKFKSNHLQCCVSLSTTGFMILIVMSVTNTLTHQ